MFTFTLNPTTAFLRQAVGSFVQMGFREGVICVAPDDVTLVARMPGVGVPVLALRMKPWMFSSFSCAKSVCLAFDLTLFYQNLFKVLKGDLLQLSGSASAYCIHFDLLNYSEKLETRQVFATQFPMLSTYIGRMNVPQLRNHYQVAVGIPAEDFRLLIMKLRQFGVLVYASITATAVEFTVGNEVVIFKKAVIPFIQMGTYHGELYIAPNVVELRAASGSVVLFLQMKPRVFHTFSCTENLCLGFDIRHLYRYLLLLQARNDAFLRLTGDASGHIDFVLLDIRTQRTFQLHIPLLSRSSVMTTVPQLQYQYQVRVGIPVQQFRVIILTLSRFGVTVSATVTDTQVQFFVGNGNGGMFTFPILKKPEQCIIEGDVGANPVSLVLDLRHTSTILNASVMSKTVWLFCQSHGSSVMLNCPFGRLGNIYYYFPEA